jgi:nitroimidazol reductase NimA-like FMN-containing flavoprotein (pyridoxamine 5'-phosphate oxidase superfamily)
MPATNPQFFQILDRARTDAVLARNRVGRLVYTRRGRLEVEPVLYACADGWLWARASYGRAWAALSEGAAHGAPVIFEVDEMGEGFRWCSVVVQGTLHPVEHPGDGGDPAVWVHAVELMRELDEAAPAASELRSSLVRIAVAEALGRERAPGAEGR